MNSSKNFKKDLQSNYAFLAKTVFDLHCLIQKQSDELYLEKEMGFPVLVSSTLLFLSSYGSASLVEIGKALNHSHQLVAQRIKILLKLNLIQGTLDPKDKRRTLYTLTEEGQDKSKVLHLYCIDASAAFQDVSDELGVDIQKLFNNIIVALKNKTFGERFPERTNTYSEQIKEEHENNEN